MGGIISLTTFLSFLPIIVAFRTFNLAENSILSAFWRIFGLISFWLLTSRETVVPTMKRKELSFTSILHDKSFLLYLLPWLIFWFVDRSEELLLRDFLRNFFSSTFYGFLQLSALIISGFSAVVFGMLSDLVGRKRIVTIGFVLIGLGYAVISLAPTNLFSWYFYIILEGIAWGIFFALFFLTLWGDLSTMGAREKYYVLGIAPFFLTNILQLFLTPYLALIPLSSAFSLAAFFLFVAVLPLMYAPETLPERKIRLRQLRSYVEAAKKIREKYLKKSGRN
jgi:MFS family permease